MGRNFRFQILEIICAAVIIILTILLLFQAAEWPILFPIIFGLATVLSLLYLFETIKYNPNRKNRQKRIILFVILSVVALGITGASIVIIYF